MNSFPSTLKTYLAQFIGCAIADLSALAFTYQRAFVSSSSDVSVPAPSEEDSQVAADMPSLVSTALDFVAQSARRKGVKDTFVQNGEATQALLATCQLACVYAQMTSDDVSRQAKTDPHRSENREWLLLISQEDNWASDPNAFIADEDDEMLTYSPRAAAIELVHVRWNSTLP